MRGPAPALRFAVVTVAALASLASAVAVADAAPITPATSSNWAGYVARPAGTGGRFSSVSGSWTEPAATCTAGREAYSAVWVGMGGYSHNAKTLEQIGTDADCTRSGTARYSTWVELLPAPSTTLPVKARPGDRMTASVTVRGTHVTLRLSNLTSGERFSVTRRLTKVDVSSAEWIVEAPSVCSGTRCQTLPLANFATVAFSAATATSGGHTRAIATGGWALTRLSLRQSPFGAGTEAARSRAAGGGGLVLASPSALAAGGAFSVRFSEPAGVSTAPEAPTLPGGPPAGGG